MTEKKNNPPSSSMVYPPEKRRDESLMSEYAKGMGDDIHFEEYETVVGVDLAKPPCIDPHTGGHKVSEAELNLMRRVAFF